MKIGAPLLEGDAAKAAAGHDEFPDYKKMKVPQLWDVIYKALGTRMPRKGDGISTSKKEQLIQKAFEMKIGVQISRPRLRLCGERLGG